MAWRPGDPWPSGTPGGAARDEWGGYIRLWVRAAIDAGITWRMGPDPADKLDSGNVMGEAPTLPRAAGGRLWVDLTCDVVKLELDGGAQSGQGIFANADAGTLTATLYDPHGIYDPLNPDTRFMYQGRSRLVPGVPVEAFCEIVNGDDGTWVQRHLFTGTADKWSEPWTTHPELRRATLVASDATKQWAGWDRPEAPAVGAGDTTAQRVQRLADYYGWTGPIEAGTSSVTLQATTLAQSAWELLNRVLDDELGWVHFTADGTLRWVGRDVWLAAAAPVLELGCPGTEAALLPIVTGAVPAAFDSQMRNAANAARTGGTNQAASNPSSITLYGQRDETRTDLAVETDIQAADWAAFVVNTYAYPHKGLESVELAPAVVVRSWESWSAVLAVRPITDFVRVVFDPTGADVLSRVIGYAHTVTPDEWTMQWQLLRAELDVGTVWTMGPHAQDRLDAGNVMGLAAPV